MKNQYNPLNSITIEDARKKSLIHGRKICFNMIKHFNNKLPPVKVDKNIKIITVMGKGQENACVLNKSNILNNKIEIIETEKYIKHYSKIKSLKEYLSENYKILPKYILYMDGLDSLIINDFLYPKNILNFYNCKILFNATPGFWHSGVHPVNAEKSYYNILFSEIKEKLLNKNQNKFNLKKTDQTSLNAGIFFGEKEFLFQIINEMYYLMSDDVTKKFPYGSPCDQAVFKFLHNKYFNDISIDLYKKIMIQWI